MGAKLQSSLVKRDAGSSPEPGRYMPSHHYTKSKSPAFRIGTETRSAGYDERKAKLVPGAGTYQPPVMAFNIAKPRFHMGNKLTHDDTRKFIQSVPGPGTHSPEVKPTKFSSPVFSMGVKLPSTLVKKNEAPGPGQYVNKAERLRSTAPSFGFGSSVRPPIGGPGKMSVPGPGAYKINTKIADAPAFAMPNRSDEHKYV